MGLKPRKKVIPINGSQGSAALTRALASNDQFRKLYQRAKSDAEGGFVIFYSGLGVFSVFFDEMETIGKISGIVPAPAPAGRPQRISISLKALDRYVSALKESGHKVWLWTSTDGVGQI